MPGVVGAIRPGGSASVAVADALAALQHFDAYRSRARIVDAAVSIGQVWRGADGSARDWAADAGVAIAVNGSVFEHSRPRRLEARDLLESYLRRDALDPGVLDGSYVIVLADSRKGQVEVINDHVGTLPVYYASAAGGVYFGPEAKAVLAAAEAEPRLSRTGVISFLNCGYCLGRTTLFDGVHCLEPGSVLRIRTDSAGVETRRHWKCVYRPDRSLWRRAAAERALHDVTRQAHETIVADSRRGFELMLTGGWDSRGVLAFLASAGRLPSAAFAWGVTKDIPASDPYLAQAMASRFGVPFRFSSYDSGRFLDNADSWCYLSELANDNMGWFAEGASALASDFATDADFSIVGDEAWGWHGHPRTESDARGVVLPPSLDPGLMACLRASGAEECAAAYEAEIDRVLEHCDSDHPFDRRDFLYLHGRVARFIFALGYYKELAVEIRRPFLLKSVLELMARVPRRFRAGKNLYISMLCRFFPEIAAIPQRRARSLPDWKHDMRSKPELRGYFAELLERASSSPVLGELLDPAACDEMRRSFFDGGRRAAPRRTPPTPGAGRLLSMRTKQRLRASGLYPGSGDMAGAYPRRDTADLLRCIALIALLEKNLPSFPSHCPERSAVLSVEGGP